MSEIIGGIGIEIDGDFSKLDAAFEAAVAKAVSEASTLADAIQKAIAPSMEGLAGAFDSAAASIGKLGDAANQAGPAVQNAGNSFATAGQNAQGASAGIGSFAEELLKLGGISLTVEGLIDLGKSAIEASDQLDDARFALEKLSGSSDAANKTLEGLEALAQDEGLSFPVLVTAGQRLQAMLPAGTDVVDILSKIGNAAELMHTSIETASNKFRNLAESGSASVRSLADLGIRLEDLDRAMRTLGVSEDLLEEGAKKAFKALDEHDRIVVLEEAMSRLDGVAKEMNNDIGGDTVRLMNQWHGTLVQLGDAIGPVARQALPALAEGLKAVVAAGAFIVTGLKIAIDAIIGLGTAAMSASTGIQLAMDAIVQGRFRDAANALKDGFNSASAAAKVSWDSVVADTKAGSDFLGKIYSTDVPASIKKTSDGLDGLGPHAKTAADNIAAAAAAVDKFNATVSAGSSVDKLQAAFENASKAIDTFAKKDLPAAITSVDNYLAAQEKMGAKASVIMEAFEKESALIQKLANESLPQASAAQLKLIETLSQGNTPLGVWNKALADEEAILDKLAKENLAAAEAGWQKLIAELIKGHAPLSTLNKALEDHTAWLDKVAKASDAAESAFIKLANAYAKINIHGPEVNRNIKETAEALDKLGFFAAKLPQPISEGNRALIDFGITAGKTKTAVEDLKTPVEQLTSSIGNLIEKAKNSGDWSAVLQALDAFDKRIQTIAKTDLPEAVREMEDWITALQKHNAPAELVQRQLELLGPLVEKMAKEGLPGATAAWQRYLEMLKQVPSAIQDIQRAQEIQLEKDQAILAGMQARGDAYGYILEQQAKVLQEEIHIAERTEGDANQMVMSLEAVRLKYESLQLISHGYGDAAVQAAKDVMAGFDKLSGAMADAIINGKNVGEALIGVFKSVGQSILKDLIDAALVPLKIAIANMLASLLGLPAAGVTAAASVGASLGSVNIAAGTAAAGLKALGAAASEAAAQINASVAASSGGGGGGALGTVGAIGAVVAAGAAVAAAILLGHISSDTGHIEVNTREAVAELANLRKDAYSIFNQTYDRIGELKNALDSIRDILLQTAAAGGGIGPVALADLDSMASDLHILRMASPTMQGALQTIATDIVTGFQTVVSDLDVMVQRLGQLLTAGLAAGNAMSNFASSADLADAVDDITASEGDITAAVNDGADQTGSGLTAQTASIGGAIIDSGNRIATITDTRLSQAISVAQQQYAAAHDASAQLNALRSEYAANQNAMEQAERNYEQALRDGNQELAAQYKASVEDYRQALLNLQGEITPLLSAEVTYTRDAAANTDEIARTIPGIGLAATGAGQLVAAHVDSAASAIGSAVIAGAALMSAAFQATGGGTLQSTIPSGGVGNGGGSIPGSGPVTSQPSSGVPVGQQPGWLPVGKPSTTPSTSSGNNTPIGPWQNTPNTNPVIIPSSALPVFDNGGYVETGGIAIASKGEVVLTPDQVSSSLGQSTPSGPDYKAILTAAKQTDPYLITLLDQVVSQQSWIAQAISNHAPPAMMDILNKQLETYQKALAKYEEAMGYAKKASEAVSAVPTPEPGSGSKINPTIDPADVVGTPEYFKKHGLGSANALDLSEVYGTPEWLKKHGLGGPASKPDPADVFGTPEWLAKHGLSGPSTGGSATPTPTAAPTPPPAVAATLSTQQYYQQSLAALLMIAAHTAPGAAVPAYSPTAPTAPTAKPDTEKTPAETAIEQAQLQLVQAMKALDKAMLEGNDARIKQAQADVLRAQEQLTIAKHDAAKPPDSTPFTGGPTHPGPGHTSEFPVGSLGGPDPSTIVGTPEWFKKQGLATIKPEDVVGTPEWFKKHTPPVVAGPDPANIVGTPEWFAKQGLGAKKGPDPADIVGTPEWFAKHGLGGQGAAPTGGAAPGAPPLTPVDKDTMDPRTIGFYAANLAELEDIRTTIHSERDAMLSVRDTMARISATSATQAVEIGSAIINSINALNENLMTALGGAPASDEALPSYDLGGYVPRDMKARLHAGEVVIPSGGIPSMPQVPGASMPAGPPAGASTTGGTVIHAPVTFNGVTNAQQMAQMFTDHMKRVIPRSGGPYSS